MIWLTIALIILLFQIATILVLEFRKPAKLIAWLSILFIFPLIGFVMYYYLAREYKHRRVIRRHRFTEKAEGSRSAAYKRSHIVHDLDDLADLNIHIQPRLAGTLIHMPDAPITLNNEVTVLTDGINTYRAMFQAIRIAKDHIHIAFYILRSDKVGQALQRLLIRKAEEGVAVRVFCDGIGSHELDEGYVSRLRAAGVEFAVFLPPLIAFFDKKINYRNHRKIVVVDGQIGFVGGLNIGQEYLGYDQKLGYWRDTQLQVRGDAVYYLQHTFMSDWNFITKQQWTNTDRYFPHHGVTSNEPVQMIASGPDTLRSGIMETFFTGITTASRSIYITSPYYILTPSMMMGLKTAAYSGVDVRILLPGVNDNRFVHWATLSYMKELMLAGVRCFQYQKGFHHAKVIIIDHAVASVGTANMDLRSFFSNFELNTVLFCQQTVKRLEADFLEDLEHSKEMQLEDFEQSSRLQKCKEGLARLLSPLM